MRIIFIVLLIGIIQIVSVRPQFAPYTFPRYQLRTPQYYSPPYGIYDPFRRTVRYPPNYVVPQQAANTIEVPMSKPANNNETRDNMEVPTTKPPNNQTVDTNHNSTNPPVPTSTNPPFYPGPPQVIPSYPQPPYYPYNLPMYYPYVLPPIPRQ